jgi:hypothetical protein
MIKLTEPNHILTLKRLREIRHLRERVKEKASKFTERALKDKNRYPIKRLRTIRVKMRSYDHIFIQSSDFLKSLYEYIRNNEVDIPIKKERYGDIFVHVPNDIYEKLSKIAHKGACSIGDALRMMILGFLKTREGRAAAIFASRLSHPSSLKDRINN